MTESKEALMARIAELEAKNAALIAANKSKPTESAVFIHPEGGKAAGPISWPGLSETKKYLESKRPDLLRKVCEEAGSEALTSRQFHEALSALLDRI